MHVLMLGWEFPPYITGGLGTACHGLTRGLDRRGIRVTFVMPKPIDQTSATHVKLLDPNAVDDLGAALPEHGEEEPARIGSPSVERREGFEFVQFMGIPAGFSNPYQVERAEETSVHEAAAATVATALDPLPLRAKQEFLRDIYGVEVAEATEWSGQGGGPAIDYGGDMLREVERYARFCIAATRKLQFDVIHAHDWMTYPAGLWVARLTGKPLVVHVHSTEFDRSGEHVNQRIYDVERRGVHGAIKAIAVSQLTKNTIVHRYGVAPDRVEVVYNGVEQEPTQADRIGIKGKDKIVLYFGRITYQKGPEYFVRAAKRVLGVMENVKFVVAGSGDMAAHMIHMAADMGIGHKMLFTGFLRGRDIERVFSMADLYVMPSVSEPFGIAPLEAMNHQVPVLISKSSGVSEVLTHALKVDFWDVDDMANKIVAILKHPPLSQTLREHGSFDVRRLTWDGAAERCEKVYRSVISGMSASKPPYSGVGGS